MIDQDLLTELQYALLEPPDGGQNWPSDLWTREEVLEGVDQGLRALLRGTSIQTARTELAVLANATSVTLPADWMATAFCVWRTLAGVRVPLGPVDAAEGDLAAPGWDSTPGAPLGYDEFEGPTLTLRLVPTPAVNGTLELLYIPKPAATQGEGGTIPVPDVFLSGIKYTALGWLLSKLSRTQDPEREQYCAKRVQVATIAANILMGGLA